MRVKSISYFTEWLYTARTHSGAYTDHHSWSMWPKFTHDFFCKYSLNWFSCYWLSLTLSQS